MWAMIATWRMSLEGIEKAKKIVEANGKIGDALELAIREVEDFPFYKSVGYGGLPNEEMQVELDAGYMDGDTLNFGAVMGIHDFANPISIAKKLSQETLNNVLIGSGAEKFAHKNGFERKNMLSDRAIIHYKNRQEELKKGAQALEAYRGHDTVGMVGIDTLGCMVSATSTSGLFMKKAGRVGDSPIIGSGFYADSEVGAATATGLGEDLMKGCISYEIVRLMKSGKSPQEACEIAVNELEKQLLKKKGTVGDLSVVAMNNKGEWGVATTIKDFSVVVASETLEPTVFLANKVGDRCKVEKATNDWLENYMSSRMQPLALF